VGVTNLITQVIVIHLTQHIPIQPSEVQKKSNKISNTNFRVTSVLKKRRLLKLTIFRYIDEVGVLHLPPPPPPPPNPLGMPLPLITNSKCAR
jgi:hypothetical protein